MSVVATELSRPFVSAEMKRIDVAFIALFTMVGLCLTGYEAYEIAMDTPCTEVCLQCSFPTCFLVPLNVDMCRDIWQDDVRKHLETLNASYSTY